MRSNLISTSETVSLPNSLYSPRSVLTLNRSVREGHELYPRLCFVADWAAWGIMRLAKVPWAPETFDTMPLGPAIN